MLARSGAVQCASAGFGVDARQLWTDLRIEVTWPTELAADGVISSQSLWILLRTGSRFPRQTAIPALNVAFPDWPFDRALQLVVPSANTSDGSCTGCRILVAAFEGTWSRRAFPADELAWVNASVAPVPTTVVVDDNVLGLPRNASIEWCARRSECGSCEATGSFVFDPSFRWQDGMLALAGLHRHFCALQESRAVRCWGWNAHGQLGAGHRDDVGDDEFWGDEPAVGVEAAEAVAVGWAHSCALTRSGQVWCWGLNAHGQLGLGDVETRLAPSRAALEGHVVSIAAGGNHSCAVWANGSLACWGANAHGQLGLGDAVARSAPTLVPVGVVRQVSAGWGHTCAELESGGVVCWGRNDFGQLGLGHTDAIGDDEAVVGRGEVVALGFDVESVACGEAHSCALLSNGTAHCWGANAWGQLGLGHNRTIGDDEGPSITSIGDIPLGLSLGSRHSCALLESQWLKCWGSDLDFQLGIERGVVLGDDEGLDLVVPVESGGDVLSVATGSSSTCIARHWGSVECWGTGAAGEVGPDQVRRNALRGSEVPVPVSVEVGVVRGLELNAFAPVKSLGLGRYHTCAVLSDGSLRCWGWNYDGQLGLGHQRPVGDTELPSSVQPVPLGRAAVSVSCGEAHTCVVLADFSVRCWGHNWVGQLGLGHTDSVGDDELPTDVPEVSLGGRARLVVSNKYHSCALLWDGHVRCWGWNYQGQLGLGHTSNIGDDELPSDEPAVSLGGEARDIACGLEHSCAVLVDGSVRCWGMNAYGELGYGHSNNIGDDELPSDEPPISLSGPVESISCGEVYTCVIVLGGLVRCWGTNVDGQLGIRRESFYLFNAESSFVELGGPAVSISAYASHTCALLISGSVRCWGLNAEGQLGLGHSRSVGYFDSPADEPAVALNGSATEVKTGAKHSCALLSSGMVRCWGENAAGQLGLGHTSIVGVEVVPMSPAQVSPDEGEAIVSISGAYYSTCSTLSSGSVRCWGYNVGFMLGLGHSRSIGDDELPSSEPAVSLNGSAAAVESGYNHACALLASGSLQCWGSNLLGQLGLGHTRLIGDDELPSSEPPVSLDAPAQAVACGGDHTCALLVTGAVRCWGSNARGQVGLGVLSIIGDNESPLSVPPVSLNGSAVSVSCGLQHTCVVLTGGSVQCWGGNQGGQLGLGHTNTIGDDELPSSVAVVSLGGPAQSAVCGSYSTCAVLVNGSVACWGFNSIGQLGLGHTRNIGDDELPSDGPALSLPGIVENVSLGSIHACAVISGGFVRCWGSNLLGELGLGHTSTIGDDEHPSSEPPVPLSGSAVSVVAAESHSCAHLSGGAVVCWGGNAYGQLGVGHTFPIGWTDFAGTTAEVRDVSELAARASFVQEPTEETDVTSRVLAASTKTARSPSFRARELSLRLRGANTSVVISARSAPRNQFRAMDFSAAVSLRSVSSEVVGMRIDDSVPILTPPVTRVADLCASKSFSAGSVCVLDAAQPWLFDTPDDSILSADVDDESNLLLPRGGSKLRIEFATPWHAVVPLSAITIGDLSCANVSFPTLTSIECVVPPGRGTNHTVAVSLPNSLLPSSFFLAPTPLSFHRPVVTAVLPSDNLSPFGVALIRIDGSRFGVRHASDVLLVANQPCDVQTWADAFIICRPRPTTSSEALVELELGGQRVSVAVSFGQPQIVSVSPTVVSPANDSSTMDFLIAGSSFGAEAGGSLSARVGGVDCDSAALLSSSRILCRGVVVPPGWRSTDAEVSFGLLSARQPSVLRALELPILDGVAGASFPTVGGVRVRVRGQGLGLSPSDLLFVQVGGRKITDALTWVSEFEVQLVLPPGAGADVEVRVGLTRSLLSSATSFSYDRPLISDVVPDYVLAGPTPQSVTIQGQNFGLDPSVSRVARIGGVACGSVHVIDDETLECVGLVTGDSGWLEPDTVWVSVAGLESAVTRGVVQTPGRPVVKEIQPFEVSRGEEITVSGSNFGLAASDVVGVSVGGHACASFSWQSQERLKCRLPVNHPMFDPGNRPANSSNPTNWLVVEVQMASGAASTVQDTVAEGSSARLAPVTWLTGKVPQAVARTVSGSREVGRFETLRAEWFVGTSAELEEARSTRVTGFLVEGEASDSTVFRAQIPLASLDRNTTEDGREWFAGELSVSSRLPIVVRVAAQNVYGTGAWSEASEPVLENCAATHFLATHRDVEVWQCEVCPAEAVCGGLGSANITAQSGFWRVPWSAFGFGFASCPRAEACVGWEGELETSSSSSSVVVPGLELDPSAIERCAEGHEGVLCASCSSGFFRDPTGGCQSCGSATWVGLRVAGLVILAMVLLGTMLLRAYRSAGEGSSATVRTLKIVFNHFQTIAIISSIKFQWPPSVSNTFAVTNSASSFGVEGVSLECVMGNAGYDPLGRSLVSISTPLWLFLFAAVFWAVEGAATWGGVTDGLRQRMRSSSTALARSASTEKISESRSFTDRWVRRMKVSVPMLIFLVHTSVTKAAFQMVTCENVAPDDDLSNSQLRLSMDLNTRCDEASSLAWMLGLSVPVLLLFSVGVPLATMVAIQRNRERLRDPETRRLFGFLFFGFREGFEGWEGVNVLRKVLLAGVTVVLGPSGAFNQVGAALFVIVVFGFLHTRLWPYKEVSFNRLEMASLFASTTTMLAGQFIAGSGSDVVITVVAPAAIFAANLFFLFLVFYQVVEPLRSERLAASAPSSGPRESLHRDASAVAFASTWRRATPANGASRAVCVTSGPPRASVVRATQVENPMLGDRSAAGKDRSAVPQTAVRLV